MLSPACPLPCHHRYRHTCAGVTHLASGTRSQRETKGKRERHLDKAYQCYDPIELLYFLLQLTEARRQPVMQRLELLRQFLPVDADPFREQRNLEGRA